MPQPSHQEILVGLLKHAKRQIMWAEAGVRAAEERIKVADPYNRRAFEKDLAHHQARIDAYQPEVGCLTWAITELFGEKALK